MSVHDILRSTQSTAKPSGETAAPRALTIEEARVYELDIRLRNGDRWAFPYSYKAGVKLIASGQLEILYSTHTVTIAGRNLLPLYESLLTHTLQRIQESTSPLDVSPDRETVIHSITVNEL